ncbi:ABC transporter permease [Kordiimonas sp. SCSIO 12610]|uniref:ABC transporter permease n=1 Tax=Kordiimonas sp. SCSIO 12610 TaxID=2829597 RepID=UPI00210E5AF5|nr:ABC transporter permease [Kordiimonas sp. SCSIO 12610]UTW56023.1 ABC transporter permease [Kordiimonas sp. SCSIO 12610]
MFKHYAVIFFRHFWKNKVSMVLSFIGLTLAFSFAYVVGVTSKDTMTSDHWLSTSERLYRINLSDFGGTWSDTTYGPFVPIINENFEEVETAVRLVGARIKGSAGEQKKQFGLRSFLVDPGFARAFPLPVIAGDIAETLSKPRGVVISKTNAERFFGPEDPIGKTISIDLFGKIYDYEVGAVLDEIPAASHLDFSMIMPLIPADIRDERLMAELTGYGSSGRIISYVLLKEGVNGDSFAKDFWRNMRPLLPLERMADHDSLSIENIRGLQFWSQTPNGSIKAPVDRNALLGVMFTAFLVLVAAVSNHMNLTIAATLRRGREVAIRRVLGASKKQVIIQLFVETLLLTGFAAWVALDIAPFIADYVGGYVGQDLAVRGDGRVLELVGLVVVAVIAALLVALYPTFWIARTHARDMLVGAQGSVTGGGGRMRTVLVGLQVALGMGLVFSTIMIDAQVRHVITMDKEFAHEGKLHVDAANGDVWRANREAFAREVSRLDGVSAHSFSTNIPFIASNWSFGFNHPKTNEHVEYEGLIVEPKFFSHYGIEPVAGRLLSEDFGGDILAEQDAVRAAQAAGKQDLILERNIVISEAVARQHGFARPEDAIGKLFRNNGDQQIGDFSYRLNDIIVGVVPDVNFKAGKVQSVPTFYMVDDPENGVGYFYLTFDIDPARFEGVLPKIEAIWGRFFPDDVFTYSRSEANLQDAYWEENLMLELFAFAGGLSLLVTITGIYSLSRFLMVQRMREVAVRRVLGARNRDILELILKEFSKPILIGLLSGLPIAGYLLNGWLSGYQERLALSVSEIFGFAVVGFLFCLGIVFSEALRAIRVQPAKVLYSE